MTVLRAIAFLGLLLVLVPSPPEAKAGMASPQPAQSAMLSVRHHWFGARCPHLCVEWFDGCNTCTCGRTGRIDVCTLQYCLWRGRPRCLRHGF